MDSILKARKREKAHRAEVEESIVSANGQLTRLQEGIARAERHVVSLEGELTKKEVLFVRDFGTDCG